MVFPRWKIALILLVCVAGMVWAAPNLLTREQADRLPSWLQPFTLGLDLQGGSHLVLEVQVNAVVKERLTALVDEVRTTLRKERVGYADLASNPTGVSVRVLEAGELDKARDLIVKLDPALVVDASGTVLTARMSDQALALMKKSAIDQSIEIVRRRIDELGTREPTIVRQGEDRIIVQLPGENNPERVKGLLGKTAKLTFHMVDGQTSPSDPRIPPGSEVLPSTDTGPGRPTHYVIRKKVEVGGDSLTDASATFDQNGQPVVSFRFDTTGARKFGDITRENVGKPFAIVLDGKVISAPVIREPILGGSGQISGNFTVQGAQDLSLLLRAGALPAPLQVLEERTVGPDLGADSIRAGAIASGIGLIGVIIFMTLTYGLFGLFANVALVLNLVLLLALLSIVGATLTLPGIAGIVLTMGMAVDANVLIFERMREEARAGRTVVSAVQAGFDRAFVTILDSNLTTLVAAGLLFFLGSGPVRGFAVTLTLGLTTSMFTAIMVTRLMLAVYLRRARPRALPI